VHVPPPAAAQSQQLGLGARPKDAELAERIQGMGLSHKKPPLVAPKGLEV